jgi:threonine aldolase
LRTIDFRSDTLTKPNEEMRKLMYEAEVGDDVYGEDPTVRRLEEKAAETVGHEAALFVTSGTQGNQLALLASCRSGEEVVVGENSHIYLYEGGAPAALGGIQLRPVAEEDGCPSLTLVRKAIRDIHDIHQPRTRMICLENTHNKAGGRVIPLEKVQAIYELAQKYGLSVHMDGARLFNAVAASGVSAREYGQYVDSIQFCLSKGLSAPVGSVLTGTKEFIEEARRWRKRLGGGLRQAGVLAAPGIYALEVMSGRLHEDHTRARKLAEYLNEVPGLHVDIDTVETNIVLCDVTETGRSEVDFQQQLADAGIKASPFGEGIIRFVTHRHITDADIEEAYTRIAQVVGIQPKK